MSGYSGYMDFLDLQTFQAVHKLWLEHNFPGQLPHQALLGIGEEVGELMHAHLKHEQKIRAYSTESEVQFRRDAMDAIGDIMVYIASYCNTNKFDMAECLKMAWSEVKDRDWKKYPGTGVPPTDSPVPAQPTAEASGR